VPEPERPTGIHEGLRNLRLVPGDGPAVPLTRVRLVERRRRPGGSVVVVETCDLFCTVPLRPGSEGSLLCETGAAGEADGDRAWAPLDFGRVRFVGQRPLRAGRGLMTAVEVRFLCVDPE
jgi:hypothetical protein